MRSGRLAFFLAAGAVLLRLVPHPWNVSPLLGAALFSGAHLRTLPALAGLLGALLAGDFLLGFHFTMPFTWGSFLACAALGRLLRTDRFRPARVAAGALGGSVLFFLVTNFGVFLEGVLYPRTWEGLAECYRMALPFFRGTLFGDLAYSLGIFGAYHLACEAGAARARSAA
jgi:hypothetical protein